MDWIKKMSYVLHFYITFRLHFFILLLLLRLGTIATALLALLGYFSKATKINNRLWKKLYLANITKR